MDKLVIKRRTVGSWLEEDLDTLVTSLLILWLVTLAYFSRTAYYTAWSPTRHSLT
jgi:hypothetical protein